MKYAIVGKISLSALVLAVASTTSQASVLFLNHVGTVGATVQYPIGGAQDNSNIGANCWTFDPNLPANAGLTALVPGSTLATFCIEGTQDVYPNRNTTFPTLISDLSLAPVGGHGSDLQKFWDAYYDSSSGAVNSAAFQLGVWEIVYDGGAGGLGSGTFTASALAGDAISASAVAQAAAWLAGLSTASASNHYQLYVLSDPRYQDQLFGVPSASPNLPTAPVPLPSALGMGMSLIGGLLLVSRLRRR